MDQGRIVTQFAEVLPKQNVNFGQIVVQTMSLLNAEVSFAILEYLPLVIE